MCGGSLGTGSADMPFRVGKGFLLVKGVPAQVCGDCGEPYVAGTAIDRIDEIVAEVRKIGTEISVVSFHAA